MIFFQNISDFAAAHPWLSSGLFLIFAVGGLLLTLAPRRPKALRDGGFPPLRTFQPPFTLPPGVRVFEGTSFPLVRPPPTMANGYNEAPAADDDQPEGETGDIACPGHNDPHSGML